MIEPISTRALETLGVLANSLLALLQHPSRLETVSLMKNGEN